MNEVSTIPSSLTSDDIHEGRKAFFTDLYKYSKLMYAAIERSMFGSPAEDSAVSHDDHVQELCLHLLANPQKLESLMKPGKAKLSTRLYELVKSRVRASRTKINRRRVLTASKALDLEHVESLRRKATELDPLAASNLPSPRFCGCEYGWPKCDEEMLEYTV